MIRHSPLIIIATLCLTACGDFRGLPTLNFNLPELFNQAPEVAKSERPAPLLQDWWKKSDDKVFVGLIKRVQKQNLSIEQARFRLLAARESARSLDYLPTLGIASEAQYNRLIEGDFAINNTGVVGSSSGQKNTTGFYNARLDSSWELPIWGQYSDAATIDKQSISYAEADLASVRANVIAEAVRIYAEMRGFQQQRLAQERIIIAQQKVVEYQNIKRNAGLIPDSELFSSMRSVLDAKSNLQITIKNEIAARYQLAALMGYSSPEKEWENYANVPSIKFPDLGDTPLDVLRNRPDIRQAEALVLREAGQLELAKADRYPRITLGGNLNQLDNITGSPLNGKTIQLTGTPSITIPLFDWGKRLAAAKAQDMKLSETASRYRETVVNAMIEVESFLSAAEAAQQNKEQYAESALLENKNQDHAALLFKQGLTDGIVAENAKINALQAEIGSLQAQVEQIRQIAALTKALGGGIPAPNTSTNEQTP